MYPEDDLLPLSALQHVMFCERQCALIHIEGAWEDNRLTVEGKQLHESAHERGGESRGDVRVARGVAIRSLRLGLSGVADVIEFHRCADGDAADAHGRAPGVRLPNAPGLWSPFPVEYKRGRAKRGNCDKVQLCAQALCLEEMLDVAVPAGALFYGRTRRRCDVDLDPPLRRETEELAQRLHTLFDARVTPKAEFAPRCRNCSLKEICMPKATSTRSASRYLKRMLQQAEHSS